MKQVLRRHGKIIMTIMGVVLMITFTLPQFSGTPRDPAAVVIGRANGAKVHMSDSQWARSELAALSALGYPLVVPQTTLIREGWPVAEVMRYPQMIDPNGRDSGIHWYLLVQEATTRGFVGVDGLVERDVGDLKEHYWDEAMKQTGGERPLRTCLTHYYMVRQMFESVAAAKSWSVPQIEYTADWAFSRVGVSYATLDAAHGWESEPAPTEAQIGRQFHLYKDELGPSAALPGAPPRTPRSIAGHSFPFGYKYPDRVQVECLVFDRATLRKLKQYAVQQDDYVNAYKRYKKSAGEATATAPATAASRPALEPWEAVKDKMANEEVERRIDLGIDKMTQRVKTLAEEPWKSVAEGDTLPRNQWVDYRRLAADIAKTSDGYEPAYHDSEILLGEAGLASLPGIGGTVLHIETPQPMDFPFPQLAVSVKELVELGKEDPLKRLSLRVGEEIQGGNQLRDKEGNVYVYRVTRAQKAHDAASPDRMTLWLDMPRYLALSEAASGAPLDAMAPPAVWTEVRAAVTEDLKKVARFKRRQGEAASLVDTVKAGSVGDLSLLGKVRNLPVDSAFDVTRYATKLPNDVAGVTGFVEAAFSMVTPEVIKQAAERVNTPITTQAAMQTSYVVPRAAHARLLDHDAGLKVFVLELVRYAAAPPGEFELARLQLLMQSDQDLVQTARLWFALDAVVQRTHYVPSPDHPLSKEGAGD